MGNLNLLWWALSLGACLGGNGTVIGASANVVVIGMAEKRGHPITFIGFFKVAFPLMLLSIVISTGYLLLWHLYAGVLFVAGILAMAVILALVLGFLQGFLARRSARGGLMDNESIG